MPIAVSISPDSSISLTLQLPPQPRYSSWYSNNIVSRAQFGLAGAVGKSKQQDGGQDGPHAPPTPARMASANWCTDSAYIGERL